MVENFSDIAILKILSGLQSGSEVELTPGEYVLGTDQQDDIQFIDVSVRPHHAKLRITSGHIALAGLTGALRTSSGLNLAPEGAFQDIEPLDVISAGTLRFALGYPTSQWSTVIEDDGGAGAAVDHRPAEIVWVDRFRLLSVPVAALCLVMAFLIWLAFNAGVVPFGAQMLGDHDDGAVTRAALDRFPFGRSVVIHQDADGTLYITGYVETPVERRALQAAVEQTGIPARVRLWVRQTIRSEVASLIAAEKVPVAFQLSDAGVLALEGVILNEGHAARFIDRVKDRILGLSRVDSKIRTATGLLSEIERLADAAQIRSFVLLRITDDLVEATGAIPAEKVDAFVGFLQSYARRFARDIPLRSFVQLQGVSTPGIDRSILVGGVPNGADIHLDPEKMAEGTYEIRDILPSQEGDDRKAASRGPAPGTSRQAPLTVGMEHSDSATGTAIQPSRHSLRAEASAESMPDGRPSQRAGSEPDTPRGRSEHVAASDKAGAELPRRLSKGTAAGSGGTPDSAPSSRHVAAWNATNGSPPEAGRANRVVGYEAVRVERSDAARRALRSAAQDLLGRWQADRLDGDPKDLAFRKALDDLRAVDPPPGGGEASMDWYLPAQWDVSGDETCGRGTTLRVGDVVTALFWLDLFSVSEAASLTDQAPDRQLGLLEVALSPDQAAACARRFPDGERIVRRSIYLREIRRNPAFIRYIVRTLTPYALDLTGADLAPPRSILTRTDRRLREGAAVDDASRVAAIGELGVAIQLKASVAAFVFGPDLAWKITP